MKLIDFLIEKHGYDEVMDVVEGIDVDLEDYAPVVIAELEEKFDC